MGSPVIGGSTLSTSAPKSARIFPQAAAAIVVLYSMMNNPPNGPWFIPPARGLISIVDEAASVLPDNLLPRYHPHRPASHRLMLRRQPYHGPPRRRDFAALIFGPHLDVDQVLAVLDVFARHLALTPRGIADDVEPPQ